MSKSPVPELIMMAATQIIGKLAPAPSMQGDLSVSWMATGSGVPVSSPRWERLINLACKAPQMWGDASSCREMFFTALWNLCSCPRISKEWAAFGKARVSPGYMKAGAFSVSFAVYTFPPGHCAMLCVRRNTEERGLGKAQLDACGVHKSL